MRIQQNTFLQAKQLAELDLDCVGDLQSEVLLILKVYNPHHDWVRDSSCSLCSLPGSLLMGELSRVIA